VGRTFNVHEALQILKRHYITGNIQTVSQFIREGRLYGERGSRKEGWKIKESDLYDFIDEEKPGIVEMVYVYDKYFETVFTPSSEDYLVNRNRMKSSFNEDKVERCNEMNTPDLVGEVQEIKDDTIKLNKELIKLSQQIERLEKINGKILSDSKKPSSHEKAIPDKQKSEKNKHVKMKFKKFKSTLIKSKVFTDAEFTSHEAELKVVYYVYFNDDGKMRDKVIDGDGYRCPIITTEFQKSYVPLIKKTVRVLLEKAKDKKLILNENGDVDLVENDPKKDDKNTTDSSKVPSKKGQEIAGENGQLTSEKI
jgi:hypothetical protein